MNIDNEQANEIIKNAQEKAKGIIEVAQAKANKILSESFHFISLFLNLL